MSQGLPALIRAGENQAGDPKPVEAQPSQAQVFCLLPSILEVSMSYVSKASLHGRLRLNPFSLPSRGLKVRKEKEAKENEWPFPLQLTPGGAVV